MNWPQRWIVLLIILVLLGGLIAQPADVVQVQIFSSVDRWVPGQSHQIAVQITIQPGWHINANKPLEEFLIPTTIELQPVEGLSFGRWQYPAPVKKTFAFSENPMLVYEGRVVVKTAVSLAPDFPDREVRIAGQLTYQACNDQTCLPPKTITFQKIFPVAGPGETTTAIHPEIFKPQTTPAVQAPQEESSELARTIESKGMLVAFVVIFLSGLALNLTPCVYPLIPITLSYFGGQAGGKKGSLLAHAILYVLGMAFTYSLLGVVAALTGQILGGWLQNPLVLIFIAAVMVSLAFSMFGLFEIRVPPSLARLAGQSKQGYWGTVFMGLTVGIIAAPCIGPFVLALFSYVGEKGNPVLGFWMFFVLSLGLGLPFIFLALFSGAINRLPRSGAWMVWVRKIFGFILIAVALYFLQPILHHPLWYMGALALTFLLGGIYLAWVDPTPASGRWFPYVRNGVGLLFVVLSLYLAVSGVDAYVEQKLQDIRATTDVAGSGKEIAWQPFQPEKLVEARQLNKPVLIDFYADWCIPCKELDKFTFTDPAVIAEVRDFIPLKADLTRSANPQVQKLKDRYNIKGVPTLVFLAPDGSEIPGSRIVGFIEAEPFVKHLQKVKQSLQQREASNP